VNIDYTLARESNVSLRIYNVAGRLVSDLVGERQRPGPYNVTWNLRDNGGVRVPSGVYFYRLVADEWTSQKKVVFIER
jgi:flagellar hook assembly protein FlgD